MSATPDFRLFQRFDTLEDKSANQSAEIRQIDGRVNSLEGSQGTQDTAIGNLKGDVQDLAARIKQNDRDLSSLDGRLGTNDRDTSKAGRDSAQASKDAAAASTSASQAQVDSKQARADASKAVADAGQAQKDATAAGAAATAAGAVAKAAQTDATQALADTVSLDGRVTVINRDVQTVQLDKLSATEFKGFEEAEFNPFRDSTNTRLDGLRSGQRDLGTKAKEAKDIALESVSEAGLARAEAGGALSLASELGGDLRTLDDRVSRQSGRFESLDGDVIGLRSRIADLEGLDLSGMVSGALAGFKTSFSELAASGAPALSQAATKLDEAGLAFLGAGASWRAAKGNLQGIADDILNLRWKDAASGMGTMTNNATDAVDNILDGVGKVASATKNLLEAARSLRTNLSKTSDRLP